ncbi:DUF349 domain-containing protein [Halochromatium roseum]|uniref:DUF349 domain-containing protein n=1 Tax=Halochromatium roseum TaxID=391920 RepID=UPI0019127216|nr:DUF349 domain-containing protein [Halochromatium roseum]MBK5941916.1 hypothetical protein [Halochromatium roseum]
MLLKRLFGRRAETKAPAAQQTEVATALESTDVIVRRNACRQLTDLRRLRDLADTDHDAGVRELAEARYRRLLCGLDANAPPLEARLAELSCAANPNLLAQTATQASDAELRLAAISQLEDAAVLTGCAINDAVAGNRLAAAERVQQKQALEQIVKAIGKRDKRVYRLARERLKQLIEQEERPQRARALGTTLCERLEGLGRYDNWLQDQAVLGHLEQQWQAIETDVDQALRDRFEHLRQRFLEDYQTYQQKQAAPPVTEHETPAEQPLEARAAPDAEQGIEQPAEPLAVGDQDHQAQIDTLQALVRRAPELDPSDLKQELQGLQIALQHAENQSGDGHPALMQGYREAERALRAQRRRRQQQTPAEQENQTGQFGQASQASQADQAQQTADQLLADLRRQSERNAVPDQRTIDAWRKRRRRLPNKPALAAASSGSEVSADASNAADTNAADITETETKAQPQLTTLQEIDQRLARLEQRFERHQNQLLRKLESLPERLTELEQHLNQGELKKADPLYQSISATLDHSRAAGVGRNILSATDERLKQIAPQLRELRHWRRWSTDEHRAQLCAQIEALAADTQHADEPSINRLEELKNQWRTLDRQGAPAEEALWERFRQAAEQIRERCRPYLEAQSALRSENRKQREALAKRLEDFLAKVDWERVDWKKLHRAEREMRQAWSRLIEAPGGDNQGARDRTIEGHFRRALRRLDRSLAEERERNQAEKQDLLEQMRALADEPDLRKAIDAAKQLQSRWQTTVPARHREENALWQQFRTASDAIFARRAAESEARGASLREHQATREAICQDLLALVDAAGIQSPEALEQQIRELKIRWNDTEALPVPRQAQSALNRQWREGLAAVKDRLANLHEAQRWAGLEHLATRAAYCDSAGRRFAATASSATAESTAEANNGATNTTPVEDATDERHDCNRLKQDWEALPNIEDAALAAAMDKAFDRVLTGCREPGQRSKLAALLNENLAQRETLCLSLEIISQVPSPEHLQTERMQRQVERLRDRMGDGETNGNDDSSTLLRDWYLSSPAAASAALEARFDRIKRALFKGAPQVNVSPDQA